MTFGLALLGLLVGLLVGLSGVGGSSLMAPLMILMLGVQPLVAVGTDLAYSIPTKLLGAIVHWRQGTVNWRVVRWLCAGGLPGAVVGLIVLTKLRAALGLPTLNLALQRGVGGLLFLVACAILLTPLLQYYLRCQRQKPMRPVRKEPDIAPSQPSQRVSLARVAVVGAVVGFLVSLTSIGAGSITVPVLYVLVPRLGLRQLVGSDVTFAALLLPVAALGHLQMGSINFALSLNLLIGALPGVLLGSRLCAYLPEHWLRPALVGVLLFAGTRLL